MEGKGEQTQWLTSVAEKVRHSRGACRRGSAVDHLHHHNHRHYHHYHYRHSPRSGSTPCTVGQKSSFSLFHSPQLDIYQFRAATQNHRSHLSIWLRADLAPLLSSLPPPISSPFPLFLPPFRCSVLPPPTCLLRVLSAYLRQR